MAGGGGRAWFLGSVAGAVTLLGTRALPAAEDAGDAVERTKAHYARAERELAAADTATLTPPQRAARNSAIEALRIYRERGDFGRNPDFPGARVPYFVDREGRRCAVAEMLHRTDGDAIVERVARTANHAWVADLESDAAFRAWLDRTGLSLAEAARIQAPTPPGFRMPAPPPDTRVETGAASSRASDAPRTPSGPSSSGASGSSGSSGGRSAGSAAPAGGASPGGSDARAGRDGSGGDDAGSWWLWWEYSKLDFVEGRRQRLGATETGADDTTAADLTALAAMRPRAVETFVAALADPDAAVRAAAAIALGRTSDAAAVGKILPLLDDADAATRERAVLALGATGSRAGAEVLLRIARGDDAGRGGSKPSAATRSLAVVALGLSRRYGLEASFDAEVAGLALDAKRRDSGDIGAAALVHGIIAPGPELDRVALLTATDPNAAPAERSLSVESLGARSERHAAAALRDLAGDRRVHVRRSAAIALGDRFDPLTVAQVKTAYELEAEPLTRGFLLLSLGRAGGGPALDFLRTELVDGPAALRPWAALALGLLARRNGDAGARAALGEADVPPSAHGAVWIAQGLARDESAVPPLAKALVGAASPSERAHAATALALIGNAPAREALAAACPAEKSEYARVVIAWALGAVGRDADADALVATLEGLQDDGLSGVAAVALGFHGGARCVEGALRVASDRAVSSAARAAAIEAAGLVLSRHPGLVLHEVSRRTNFPAMPDWLQSALSVTL